MDRNTYTGLFLILIIIVGSTFLMKPSEAELKKERLVQYQDSVKRANAGKPTAALKTTPAPGKQAVADSTAFKGPFGGAIAGTSQLITLENEHLKVSFDTRGGRIASVLLKEYKTYDKKPLVMFEGKDSKFGLVFNTAGALISTNDLYFTPSSSSLSVARGDSSSISFRLTYSEGKYIDYIYSLTGDSFKVGFTIRAQGMEDVFAPNKPLTLNWEALLKQKEKDVTNEQPTSTAYYLDAEDKVTHLETAKDEQRAIGDKGKIQWISFKQHFFSNVLIAREGFTKGTLSVSSVPSDPRAVKAFAANMQLPYSRQAVNAYPMEFYFGPNKFSILEKQGYELERQVEMGYWPLKYINRYVVLYVFRILDSFNWNYGLIILVLTLLLKVVLSPLTYKSYLSMAKMRVLKPEMDEIKAKVGEDNPTLLQQEYLKLYKKAGVNPLGGCIPMLLQLPIVMAFFFFFPNLFELRQQSFLWMDDLSTYDAFINFGIKVPFIGNHLSLMCILMTISTLIYTYFNNQISGATGQMKYIGYISPIIFLGVLNSYPAGLNYYYFLANMLTFAQQFLIRQMVNDDKIHAQIQENKKKPETAKKKSGFQQRMEDYMRQQQQTAKGKDLPASSAKPKKK
ncbi:membrane protein insertase YidC [Hufsiella ginkgonis]|uniref:Membrane protein insertase YidC n=1 Tax=Hufsiella ginkgonis TaxID=2695274 RepID=A0A7K1XZ62_9SPHI|nr:membrane protein insertase YidC [Hufsiella ginkgonis]MXV16294.1 membrane protein insertase YidC [Hufsiella ginkgonis]